MPNLPIICDPSHISGKREYLYDISQKAFDMGFDGLIVESHIDPSKALSDKEQQLTPSDLKTLLDKLVIRKHHIANSEYESKLDMLRSRIDTLDAELIEILSARAEIVNQIALYKKTNNVMALQIDRWTKMMNDRVKLSSKLNLDPVFIKILFQLIHEDSVRQQTELIDKEEL
jgi:chorismate mutase